MATDQALVRQASRLTDERADEAAARAHMDMHPVHRSRRAGLRTEEEEEEREESSMARVYTEGGPSRKW